MDRRSFLKLASLIPATALFGCKGTSQEKSQETAKDEAKKSDPVAVKVANLKDLLPWAWLSS